MYMQLFANAEGIDSETLMNDDTVFCNSQVNNWFIIHKICAWSYKKFFLIYLYKVNKVLELQVQKLIVKLLFNFFNSVFIAHAQKIICTQLFAGRSTSQNSR